MTEDELLEKPELLLRIIKALAWSQALGGYSLHATGTSAERDYSVLYAEMPETPRIESTLEVVFPMDRLTMQLTFTTKVALQT